MPDPILLFLAMFAAQAVFLSLSVAAFFRTRRYARETRGTAAYVRIARAELKPKLDRLTAEPVLLPFARPKPRLRIAETGEGA